VESDTRRFSLFTPGIDTSFTYTNLALGFQIVCDEQAMPMPITNVLAPRQIVLSMSTMDAPFLMTIPTLFTFLRLFDLKMAPVSRRNSDVRKKCSDPKIIQSHH
jgi:hypothetical protein